MSTPYGMVQRRIVVSVDVRARIEQLPDSFGLAACRCRYQFFNSLRLFVCRYRFRCVSCSTPSPSKFF